MTAPSNAKPRGQKLQSHRLAKIDISFSAKPRAAQRWGLCSKFFGEYCKHLRSDFKRLQADAGTDGSDVLIW